MTSSELEFWVQLRKLTSKQGFVLAHADPTNPSLREVQEWWKREREKERHTRKAVWDAECGTLAARMEQRQQILNSSSFSN